MNSSLPKYSALVSEPKRNKINFHNQSIQSSSQSPWNSKGKWITHIPLSLLINVGSPMIPESYRNLMTEKSISFAVQKFSLHITIPIAMRSWENTFSTCRDHLLCKTKTLFGNQQVHKQKYIDISENKSWYKHWKADL